ncbi:SMC5-SMC6 complex localization factor protein 2 [Dunckerocampus dactyliophorus]|uniref:SMC5-SMC6 complex localization factor protein 2 n=1 Tax=Dunckerocampus dactyliophorus TaxID=161453 RepID=UPI0024076F84|nr:SMC5-SMC6 complex localization factor protein 2 [Dunckerocampus dactyliophorus]
MKNGAENQGDTRTLKKTQYYSPRTKEMPMKPSQITNRLIAKPRRMLPLGSPECQPYRAGSPCRSSCPLAAQINSSRSCSQGYYNLAKQHTGDKPATLYRPQPKGLIHDGSHHCRPSVSHAHPQKDSSIRFPSSDIRKDHKLMVVSNSGRSTTELRLQSNKDQRMPKSSSEKSIPVSSSQKRHRECDDYDGSVKKLCPSHAQAVHGEPPTSVFSIPLKTSKASLPSLRHSSVLQPKIPDEPTSGQSTCLGLSSTSKQLSCTSLSSKPIVTRQPPSGAKQLQIHSSHNNIVQLESLSKNEEIVHRRGKEYDKRHRASTEVPKKSTTNSLHCHIGSPFSRHTHRNSSPVRTLSRLQQTEETRKPHSVTHKSKLNGASLSVPAKEREKPHRRRRTIMIPDDINDLFTPDVIIRPVHKTPKTKTNFTLPTTEKRQSSSVQSSGSASVKGDDVRLTCSAKIQMSSANHPHMSLPSVSLIKMDVKNLMSICVKDAKSNCPVASNESLKSDQKNKSVPNSKTHLGSSKQPSTSDCSQSPPIKREPIGGHRQQDNKSVDEDLDLDLGITLNLDSSQTSESSESDQLISLHKTPKTDFMSPTTEKRHSSIVQSSQSCSIKGDHFGLNCSANIRMPSANLSHISLPTVSLFRMKVENVVSICSKGANSSCPVASNESFKSDEENKFVPNSKTHFGGFKQPSTYDCSRSPPIKREPIGGHSQQTDRALDPLEEDIDFDLGITLDLESSQTSNSSEDEQLISLQEIMNHNPKLPDTPGKSAISELSTPGCSSKLLKAPISTRRSSYMNSYDQMIEEIDTYNKAKEDEAHIRTELLRIEDYEDVGVREESISSEQQEFVQRYSLVSSAIKEVPPGEVVFDLEKFGQIFTQDSLQLRRCMVKPQSAVQKTLLWSSPAQLRLHVNIGLFQEAYGYNAPCPTQVTDFLFKMMSVHSERMISDKMLQALCDIASSAAYNIVKNGSQQFNVWVPSLADVTLVLINMGVAFVTLFPLENLQPAFTEGDLLKDVCLQSDCPSSSNDWNTFPEHNCNNIFKYLSYCLSVCPLAYSDYELLLLLTMVARVCLDTHFISLPCVESYTLLYKTVNVVRDWDAMLPRICQAFTDLTDDHHNMCLLVQLLPDNTHGKCLRQHLSLSMISKLLDGTCQYRPTGAEEIQLADLRPYVRRMQPSLLLHGMLNTSSTSPKEDDVASLDQQSYYLCYSLLTLTNEVSNFHIFPAHQKEQLLILCSELVRHVKCGIRESTKCLYRCKVKDLLAMLYTKWQMLLQQSKPLHCQLYDYWKPSPAKTLACIETDCDDRQQASSEESGGDRSDDFASADEEADDAKH